MVKNEIGKLITKGMSTEEIRQRIKDFPDNPDNQYFENLGYSRATAVTYRSKLKKNNLKQKNQTIVEQEDNEEKESGTFIMSENADKDNIIFDTCALAHKETIDIIEECTKVTVIYHILKEFGSIESNKNKEENLKRNIRKYSKKILEDEKYRLVPFKWEEEKYTDDMILEYLMQMPVKERETILTVDKNLAVRAKCLGLEYILYQPKLYFRNSTTREDSNYKPKKERIENSGYKQRKERVEIKPKGNLGVNTNFINDVIEVKKHNPEARIFIVKGEECFEVSGKMEYKEADYLAIIAKSKKKKSISVQKVKMVEGEKVTKQFRCYYVNEIYMLDEELHPTILDSMKSMIL